MTKRLKTSQSLVAFVDLLGFSDRVTSAKTPEDLNAIYQQILTVREEFEHEPPTEKREVHRRFQKRVLAFSDSVVISIGSRSRAVEMMGDFDALGLELTLMAYAQGECTPLGYFLAGGIDLGPWAYTNDVLISPALVRAYQLHERTRMPVLAVTETVYEHLQNAEGRKYYSHDYDPFQTMFRVQADEDGNSLCFLNYLEICIESLDWDADLQTRREVRTTADPEKREELRVIGLGRAREGYTRQHAKVITDAYAACPLRARKKYKFLKQYHDSIVTDLFGERPDLTVPI